jgi:cardiolipin synthase A/B
MVAFVSVVAFILGIATAIHAIMHTRTSQGAVAWAVSLVTIPYLSVPAYWVLGRKRFHGYVLARRSHDETINAQLESLLKRLEPYRVPETDQADAAHVAEKLAAFPLLLGNRAHLLIDGAATFQSIFDGIDAATNYILFQFFIVHDDDLGRRIQQRLIAKAREGVRVYFLYDDIGSYSLPRHYTRELSDAGVHVHSFHARRGRGNRFQIIFRNHRKIVVVDGKSAWIGGHNVGDEYLGKDKRFGHWRDTHVRIDGPAVVAAQVSFAEDWFWASGELLELEWNPQPAPEGNAPVLMVPTGPADELETAGLMFVHAINSATKRIWIASPYFVPDEALIAALQLAGLRGVDVRILIPDRADHLLVYLAAFSYFDDAGLTGVQFYRYQDGFLHEKVLLVDDSAAAVGTANFDNRSFRLNFEITVLVADAAFVKDVEQMFVADFARSRKVAPTEYADRPYWFRFAVRLARLTSPML